MLAQVQDSVFGLTSPADKHCHRLSATTKSATEGKEEEVGEEDGAPPEDVCQVSGERDGGDGGEGVSGAYPNELLTM